MALCLDACHIVNMYILSGKWRLLFSKVMNAPLSYVLFGLNDQMFLSGDSFLTSSRGIYHLAASFRA